ncbi:MAG: HAMP domain-containing protein [Bdellovibrionota bacterium]
MAKKTKIHVVKTAPNAKFKRDWRNILINPKFQLTFLAYMASMAVLSIAVFYACNYYFFWKFQRMGMEIGLPADNVFFQFVAQQRSILMVSFSVTGVILFTLLCISGLIFSHRASGPIYRLRKHMTDIAGGKPVSEVHFRDKDFFPELADAYNEQLKRFKSGRGSARKAG